MATDDPDTDDENEERTGPDAGRSPESPETYANAGRERGTGEHGAETRQQSWDAPEAPDDAAPPADTVPENTAPTDRRHPEGGPAEQRQPNRRQPTRRYGKQGESERPPRRYGSRPPSGVAERTEDRPQGGELRGGSPAEGRPHDEGRVREQSDPGEQDRPESGDRVWVEKPGRTEQTPPKRTQPLREPTETSDASDRETGREPRSETGHDRGPEMGGRELEVGGPEPDSETESTEQSDVPKYGGPRDSSRKRSRGQSAERQRTQREYERRFDREQARQRDFQRDKSGGKYRRR